MPLLTHDAAIEKYYEEVKHKYPDVDFNRFRTICRTPFEFIKLLIKGTRMPMILVKYLGKFYPGVSRVKSQLRFEEIFYKKRITTLEEYQEKKTYLQNYLNDYYDEPEAEFIDDTE